MKSELYILTIFASLISCDSKVSEKKSLITQDSSKNTITIDEEQIGVVYSSEVVKVWADTLIDAKKISNTSLKFEPYIYFEDFKIEQIYNGTKAQIDYNSNKIAREFRTVITSEYSKSRVNFGGHYCIIT